jgi:hypothetical protein
VEWRAEALAEERMVAAEAAVAEAEAEAEAVVSV